LTRAIAHPILDGCIKALKRKSGCRQHLRKSWEGEFKVTPFLKKKNIRLRRVWGFSDGVDGYIYFDQQYWRVVLENDVAYFYAIHTPQVSVLPVVIGSTIGLGSYMIISVGSVFYPVSSSESRLSD